MSRTPKSTALVAEQKSEITHLASTCLLREPRMEAGPQGDKDNAQLLLRLRYLVHSISLSDGEYVPKLALYLRHELSLRTLPNFLMALCAREPGCLPTYECYLEKLLVLPSDWLSVASFSYFDDADNLHNHMSAAHQSAPNSEEDDEVAATLPPPSDDPPRIPNVLRKALRKTFLLFNEFSLAKYDNERATHRRRSRHPAEDPPHVFTLKRLIRTLHISAPPYVVCCVLGKRYPATVAAFQQMGLGEGRRRFDPALAGTRMALPRPLTWDRALSARGNSGAVWDDLFRQNAVPFMATLRNLRNIVRACVSEATHQQILDRLRSEEQVGQSRQFPYRFYSAREAIMDAEVGMAGPPPHRRRGRGRVHAKGKQRRSAALPAGAAVIVQRRKLELLDAIDCAVDIAAKLNIPPMKGNSVLILSVFPALLERMGDGGSKKKAVSKRTKLDAVALLVCMMQRACEACTMVIHCLDEYSIYSADGADRSVLEQTADLVEHCSELIREKGESHPNWLENSAVYRYAIGQFPFAVIDKLVTERKKVESVVVLDEGHHTYACMNADAPSFGDLPVYLSRLRHASSPNLVYVGLNVGGPKAASTRSSPQYLKSRYNHSSDFLLSGFSDAVLRLIAERSGGGQEELVERADVTYQVQKTSSRLTNEALEKKRKLMSLIQQLEATQYIPPRLERMVKSEGTGSCGATDTTTEPPFSPALSTTGGKGLLEPWRDTDSIAVAYFTDRPSTQHSTVSELPPLPELGGAPPRPQSPAQNQAALQLAANASPVVLAGCKSRRTEVAGEGEGASLVPRRLLSSYRVWRFFISSTFLDMNSERNALTLDVFPRLRRWIAACGLKVSLMEVDLRWGITQEASAKNLSTSVCLNEVARCAPFFIGMLGSRYGYVPNPLQVFPDDDVALQDFDWLQRRELYEQRSVTELEIKQGLFSSRLRREPAEKSSSVLLFVRDNAVLQRSLRTDAERQVYAPDSSYAAQRLEELEQYLREEGVPVTRYRCTVKRPVQSGTTPSASTGLALPTLEELVLPAELREKQQGAAVPTSKEVPLHMRDFSRKAFRALQQAIATAFGVPLDATTDTAAGTWRDSARNALTGMRWESRDASSARTSRRSSLVHTSPASLDTGEYPTDAPPVEKAALRKMSSDYYASLFVDLSSFMESLCRIYVPPRGFVQSLANYALSVAPAPAPPREEAAAPPPPGADLMLVVAQDGNGKSSALAALAQYLLQLESPLVHAVYYSVQGAGETAVRTLLFFVATTLVMRGDLHSTIFIDEGAETDALLGLFSRIASALRKKRRAVVLVLDLVHFGEETGEFCRCFQQLYNVLRGTDSRFILAAPPQSAVIQELRRRFEGCIEVAVPALREEERADVVRRHLAAYGKRLQESWEINELQGLLRKADAGHVSYLTTAIMYLRLFSTFDTLRSDIMRLPGTTAELFPEFFSELERRFDHETCLAVFTSLYLRHGSGGVLEYNLYRLMTNVAAAARLVALLSGTCITSRDGCISIRTSFFYTAIGETYFRSASSVAAARNHMLAAELLGEPINTHRDAMRTSNAIRVVTLSLDRSTRSAAAPRSLFQPHRYGPHELLGILQTCIQAEQHDLLVALLAYLPFLGALLVDSRWLQRFMSCLAALRLSGTSVIVRKVADPIAEFIMRHYHILCCRPDLLVQCVRNMPPSFTAIREPKAHAGSQPQPHPSAQVNSLFPPSATAFPPSHTLLPSPHAHSRPWADLAPQLPALPVLEQSVGPSPAPQPPLSSFAEELPPPCTEQPQSAPGDQWVRWANQQQHGGEARQSVLSPSGRPVRLLAASPSGSTVAYACDEVLVRVGQVANWHDAAMDALSHSEEVTALAFGRDETLLFTGTVSGTVWVWKTQGGTAVQMGACHTRAVTSLSAHPSDSIVCSSSLDTRCVVWDCSGPGARSKLRASLTEVLEHSGRPLGFPTPFLRGAPKDCGWAPLVPLLTLRQQRRPVSSACFHRAGAVLASGAWDGTVALYDFGRLRDAVDAAESLSDCVPCQLVRVGSPVRVVCFRPSMVITCAVGRFDGAVSLIDYASLAESACLAGLHHAPLSALTFSPDGKLMATADTAGAVKVSYAGLLGTLLATFNGHRDHVTAVLFREVAGLPAALTLVTSSLDATLQVWLVDREAGAAIPTAHAGAVTAVACTDDGRTFVTGGDDGAALVFTLDEDDVAAFYQRCRLFRATEEPNTTSGRVAAQAPDYRVPSFALSHDGRAVSAIQFAMSDTRLLTGVVTGDVYVWRSEPGLDRRAGRLLYIISVPSRGSYPVVSLECVGGPSLSDCGAGEGTRAPSRPACTARAIAVCANGEVATFDLHSDAVSVALRGGAGGAGGGKEEVLRVGRQRLRWLQPLSGNPRSRPPTPAPELPGAEAALHREQAMALAYGEEIRGVLPVLAEGCHVGQREGSQHLGVVIGVTAHVLLLLGRTKLFVSSIVLGEICEVPLLDVGGCPLERGPGERFTSISRGVGKKDGDTVRVHFLLATSAAALCFCELVLCCRGRHPAPLAERVRITARPMVVSESTSQRPGRCMMESDIVESVDLRLVETQEKELAASVWLVLVGCRGGATHLFQANAGVMGPRMLVKELGVFFGASGLTSSMLLPPFSATLATNDNQRAALRLLCSMGLLDKDVAADGEAAPLLHWVAGDYLGNIYQLRLVVERAPHAAGSGDHSAVHSLVVPKPNTAPLPAAVPCGPVAALEADPLWPAPVLPLLPGADGAAPLDTAAVSLEAQLSATGAALPELPSFGCAAGHPAAVPLQSSAADVPAHPTAPPPPPPPPTAGPPPAYFSVLLDTAGEALVGQEALAFHRYRQEVLQEAMRVQHYNIEARQALSQLGQRSGAAAASQLQAYGLPLVL